MASGRHYPPAGRIVAVADVFDALTHERPYKGEWSVENAVDEISGLSGTHFDPFVVDAFESVLISQGSLAAMKRAA